MSEVVVVVDVVAAEGKGQAVVDAFEAVTGPTHDEEGCVAYALHRDTADADHFVLVERWRSQADLDAHMALPHTAELFAFAGGEGNLAQPPQLTVLSAVGLGTPEKGVLQGAGTPAG
jgi:quinol monooxygenase YgiN